jgi:hypothetical protein
MIRSTVKRSLYTYLLAFETKRPMNREKPKKMRASRSNRHDEHAPYWLLSAYGDRRSIEMHVACLIGDTGFKWDDAMTCINASRTMEILVVVTKALIMAAGCAVMHHIATTNTRNKQMSSVPSIVG